MLSQLLVVSDSPYFLLTAGLLLLLILLLLILLRHQTPLPDLPIIGVHQGDWFPVLQAKWRNTLDFRSAMEQAYSQQEQHGHSAVIVPVAGEGNLILLPRSETDFVAHQPDSILSLSEDAFARFQVDYTFMDPAVPRATLHEKLLRTALTPQLGNLIPALADETIWAMDKYWGTDTAGWREVCVFETMRYIGGGVTNRALVGLPYCRDPELVNSGMAFAQDIPLSGALLNLFPSALRPLVAPLVTIPNRIHTRRFRRVLEAEIEKRLRDYEDADDSKIEPPNDFLQWAIRQAKAMDNPYLWRSSTLADRILLINFASGHSTSFALTWAIFDLLSASPEKNLLVELREEITSVLLLRATTSSSSDTHGGGGGGGGGGPPRLWSKSTLAQLVKLDSAMRESARLSSILTVGLGRTVVAPDGMVTPSGLHLRKGTRVVVPAYSVMRDDTVYYPDAKTFRPFRFCGEKQQQQQQQQQQDDEEEQEKTNMNRRELLPLPTTATSTLTLPTTTPDFLTFGHGRHACPGRFFAAAEIKLILAHAILHYDFEMVDRVKPEGPWYGLVRVPPVKATIRVRRRKDVGVMFV